MKSTSLLDNGEIRRVSSCFDGIFKARNRALFMLGVSTSGCISELLSLHGGGVYQNNKPVTGLLFDKFQGLYSELQTAISEPMRFKS